MAFINIFYYDQRQIITKSTKIYLIESSDKTIFRELEAPGVGNFSINIAIFFDETFLFFYLAQDANER